MGSNFSRIIVDFCLCFSIFILPWWISLLFMCGAFFIFESFYEGLFLGLTADLLFFTSHELFYNLPIIFFLSLFAFLLISFLKKQLRLNHQ